MSTTEVKSNVVRLDVNSKNILVLTFPTQEMSVAFTKNSADQLMDLISEFMNSSESNVMLLSVFDGITVEVHKVQETKDEDSNAVHQQSTIHY